MTHERPSPRLPLILHRCVSVLFCRLGFAQASRELPRVFCIDPASLVSVKQTIAMNDPALRPAMEALLKDADKAMKVPPASVMDKPVPLPGGDKHDYVSYAPYFWPNPDRPDGLPFVRHDGKRNREQVNKGDAPEFERLMGAVSTLALAYELSGRKEFAEHAARLLRVWFIDEATRMNPNFTHGQVVMGVNTGRGTGLIEFASMPHFVDALGMLQNSPAWTKHDQQAMTAWLMQYAQWLATSKEAGDERKAANNHGSWFDAHEVSLLMYLGRNDEARKICELARQKRIARQIESDGRQPLEEARADGFGYSLFNVNALMTLASLAQRLDVDLSRYQTADGRSLRRAVDYLAPYADPQNQWPHNQLNALNRAKLIAPLLRAASEYGEEPYRKYLKWFPEEQIAQDRTNLMIAK